MNKLKRFNNPNKKYVTRISIFLVCLCVLILAIGFSSYQTGLDISEVGVVVRVQKDIRITNVSVASTSSQAISSFEDYNVNSIHSRVDLPNSDSTITFNVEVTNLGNIEMGLMDVLNLDSHLQYTINNYTMGSPLCDDSDSTVCKLGAVTTLSVTVSYKDGAYTSSNTEYDINMKYMFYALNSVARIGNVYYDTLQDAIDDVAANDTAVTIEMLNNTQEALTVNNHQVIILDMQGFTISNKGAAPVFENKGIITMNNGNITSDTSQGAVNVSSSTGIFNMVGGSIIATGTRQAIYNNGGTVNISGGALLTNTSTVRAVVQNNTAASKITITDATIIAENYYGIENKGSLTIGTQGGEVSTTNPMIQGATYGISSTQAISFYDGILKGETGAINNPARITTKEAGYELTNDTENIDGAVYKTLFLTAPIIVTFDANGGSVNPNTKSVAYNSELGIMPTPTRTNYIFLGWYTDPDDGEQISGERIITSSETFYAHWIDQSQVVTAKIGNTNYSTLQAAVNAVPANGVETTITLMRDTIETITVAANKNIAFDLQTYSITNSANSTIFENNGTIKITNGTLNSIADYSAVNNNATGKFIMSGGSIIATGTRQAIYNNGGIVEISGSAYLEGNSSGAPTTSSMERGTIQNLVGGRVTITGGTIIAKKQQAISNEGTLTIGVDDNSISTTSPVIRGATYGIKTADTFNYYDGKIMGVTDAINGTITDQAGTIVNSTETISGKNYKTVTLS